MIRWAETNGSESNMYRKNAWIYRDYVIRAFNEDTPYNDFLTEQIAGDVIGQGDATGYLVSVRMFLLQQSDRIHPLVDKHERIEWMKFFRLLVLLRSV